jgi:hypothetical protein
MYYLPAFLICVPRTSHKFIIASQGVLVCLHNVQVTFAGLLCLKDGSISMLSLYSILLILLIDSQGLHVQYIILAALSALALYLFLVPCSSLDTTFMPITGIILVFHF